MNTIKLLKIIAIAFAVIIVVLVGVLVFVKPVQGPTVPGPSHQTSTTEYATSPDGRLVVRSPLPGALVSSPLAISGTVTGGGWFFEAVFPVEVLDGNGTVLGQGQAQAQSDWMTTGTVPFAAEISFTAQRYATGTVVFAKDNPSGMPQNAEDLRIPVRFK
jgi:hypothetical protein